MDTLFVCFKSLILCSIIVVIVSKFLHLLSVVSSRQLTEAGSSGAGSHSKSFDQAQYRPYQSGGDSGDALSVTSVSSSGSDLEDVNPSFLSDSPEGHERKVKGHNWDIYTQCSRATPFKNIGNSDFVLWLY